MLFDCSLLLENELCIGNTFHTILQCAVRDTDISCTSELNMDLKHYSVLLHFIFFNEQTFVLAQLL